jgi:hypothetical protein
MQLGWLAEGGPIERLDPPVLLEVRELDRRPDRKAPPPLSLLGGVELDLGDEVEGLGHSDRLLRRLHSRCRPGDRGPLRRSEESPDTTGQDSWGNPRR